jgi:hypothetical protein
MVLYIISILSLYHSIIYYIYSIYSIYSISSYHIHITSYYIILYLYIRYIILYHIIILDHYLSINLYISIHLGKLYFTDLNEGHLGMIPLTNHDSRARSQWGRYIIYVVLAHYLSIYNHILLNHMLSTYIDWLATTAGRHRHPKLQDAGILPKKYCQVLLLCQVRHNARPFTQKSWSLQKQKLWHDIYII